MAKHKISITTGRREPLRVEVDGRDIASGLHSINVNIGPDGVPQVEAEVAVSMIDIVSLGSADADVMISLPLGAREALVALGWTPPAGDR